MQIEDILNGKMDRLREGIVDHDPIIQFIGYDWPMPTAARVLARLRDLGSAENVAGMARFGIVPARAYGVPAEPIARLAREIGRNTALATQLWDTGVHEARILAAFVIDPAELTRKEMERWTREFDNWAVCDNCCIHLFRKTPFAWEKAITWSGRRSEFAKRAGFATMAALAVHDKRAPDQKFLDLLPIIEREAADQRNFVKKAVNWALRQIGKRNAELCKAAMETASRLKLSDSASARWIGSDALRELKTKFRTLSAGKTG
ncbi:MAG TPA: DNA alkylation repair protein [Bryobacteraceae bacterium]|jgi:3-methyladenine DNA glycosylase AlkD